MLPGFFYLNRMKGVTMNYYLGIDVSKGYADFVFINDKKKVIVNNFQLDDTFEGHSCFCNRLSQFVDQYPNSTIYAAVESTGGYENNWFNLLQKCQQSFPIQAARLNPLGVNANSKANLQRITTDKISAKNVAEYLIAHPEKVKYQSPDNHFVNAQKQWRFIKTLTKQKAQLLNQLESHVYSANPELLSYCKDGFPLWVLFLLQKFPTAKKLSKAKVNSVKNIQYLKDKKVESLINNANKSVASDNSQSIENIIKVTVDQILSMRKVIKEQHKILVTNFSSPEALLLDDIPSIGIESAVGLMIEIQYIERFQSVKKLAAFFGLHPVFKESGDGGSGYRMSKQGRKAPRCILYMVTLSAIQRNPIIKEIYEERVSKGMNKMAAIGLCMHKMCRIIYGMLKNKSQFNAEIDRQNRKDKKVMQSIKRIDSNRRFQPYDAKAPTSRRQANKRKEQMQTPSHSFVKLNSGSKS